MTEILNAFGDVLSQAWLNLLIGVLIVGPVLMFLAACYWVSLVSQYWTVKGDE